MLDLLEEAVAGLRSCSVAGLRSCRVAGLLGCWVAEVARAGAAPLVSSQRSPQLPPFLFFLALRALRRVDRGEVHLPADVVDAPAGQSGEVPGFLLLPVAHGAAISGDSFALRLAGPGMVEDVAGLEVRPVAGRLEDEVLREMLAVVADVEAGEGGIRASPAATVGSGGGILLGEPESAQTVQLVAG